MARLGYRPALDGLRGIAIIAVFSYHELGWPHGGLLGVDLFFVLSGFLITTLLLEERHRPASLALAAFYQRRARRLFPALGAFAVAFLVLSIFRHPERAGHWLALTAQGCLYIANLLRGFSRSDPLSGEPFGHMWSLAAEEQFYLVWPLLLLWLHRRHGLRAVTAFLVGALVAATIYRAGLTAAGYSLRRIYFAPDTHSTGLMLGALAAVLRWRGLRVPGWTALPSLVAVMAFIFSARYTAAWIGYWLILAEFACAVAVLNAAARPSRLLTSRPLVWFGLISYSLYLWHYPLIRLAHGRYPLLTALGALACAAGSYYVIERPFRRGRARHAPFVPVPAPVPTP